MKRSDVMLLFLLIIFLGLGFWLFTTGRFNSTVGQLIDGVWNSLEGLIRPIFR